MRFSMSIRCEDCEGKGTTESIVYEQDIMLIVLHNVEDGEVQKIPAIKQVRNEYGLGLKAAKELVEGAMEFYSAIKKNASHLSISGIPNPDAAREEGHAA